MSNKLRLFALGGLDEDGKNMFIVEDGDDIFVIEAGLKYPDSSQLGIEMVIPDFSYLIENASRVRAIFITHGHEDVMAALPQLCKVLNVPIYTAALTAQILKRRFMREGIKDRDIHVIKRNGTYKIANHKIKTFGVTQSIADAFGIAIYTAQGYVVYTSEFIVASITGYTSVIELDADSKRVMSVLNIRSSTFRLPSSSSDGIGCCTALAASFRCCDRYCTMS